MKKGSSTLMLYRSTRSDTDIFLIDDVPEEERKAVARQVADQIITIVGAVGSDVVTA